MGSLSRNTRKRVGNAGNEGGNVGNAGNVENGMGMWGTRVGMRGIE